MKLMLIFVKKNTLIPQKDILTPQKIYFKQIFQKYFKQTNNYGLTKTKMFSGE